MWIAATVGQLSFRGSYSSLRGKGGIFHQELTFVFLKHVLESLDPNISCPNDSKSTSRAYEVGPYTTGM